MRFAQFSPQNRVRRSVLVSHVSQKPLSLSAALEKKLSGQTPGGSAGQPELILSCSAQRSVQEQHGSTEAWIIAISPSAWPRAMARIAGKFKSDGVRIFTRAGVSEPSLFR